MRWTKDRANESGVVIAAQVSKRTCATSVAETVAYRSSLQTHAAGVLPTNRNAKIRSASFANEISRSARGGFINGQKAATVMNWWMSAKGHRCVATTRAGIDVSRCRSDRQQTASMKNRDTSCCTIPQTEDLTLGRLSLAG
jgi:hypothetical protein